MARQRVMNFEMEASALLVLATLARCRAGVVCAVYANRTTGQFIDGPAKDAAEAACVETGLESLLVMARMDAQKHAAGTDRWRPSLWSTEATPRYPERMRDKGSRDALVHPRRSQHGRGLLRQGQEEGRSREPAEDHDEERQARDPGHVPGVRRQGLQIGG